MTHERNETEVKKPWYTTVLGILFIVFTFPLTLPPVLLYVIWAKSKQDKTVKIILTAVIAIITLAIWIPALSDDKAQTDIKSNQTVENVSENEPQPIQESSLPEKEAGESIAVEGATLPEPEQPKEPEFVEVSATKLVKDYESNALLAEQTYKGKRLRITGKVSGVQRDLFDTPYITLDAGGFSSVQCYIDELDVPHAAKIKKGTEMFVQGYVKDYIINVLIEPCVFLYED